ncbi:MAG: glycogen debranching enzyme N-terminal domain-containing protein [Firmicutes bacterium]|nr:glycogen debranching enzyme N-terminal domain-containing protein [Candidatus Fermentithermobacillaceae bacterium]
MRENFGARDCWSGFSWLERRRKPSFQEWLETDGLGGFASSTSYGIHTRRYHGWLFVAGSNPGDRWLFLSKMEERLTTGDGRWELGSNLYPGALHPRGIELLWAWQLDPHPVFLYKAGPVILRREIFMVKGRPGVFIVYKVLAGPEKVEISLRPLVNSRFYHHLAREGQWAPEVSPLGQDVSPEGSGIVLSPHGAGRSMSIWVSRGSFRNECVWYRSMVYPRERERGLDFIEDHLCPGEFQVHLCPGETLYVWAGPLDCLPIRSWHSAPGTSGDTQDVLERTRRDEIARRLGIHDRAGGGLGGRLSLAADSFVIKTRTGEPSIIAGYHWFGEWGRDTFISLPGLLLASGRHEEARGVFLRFSRFFKYGLIPNFIGDEPAYNSVDASLWFVVALGKYIDASGDRQVLRELYPAVRNMIRALVQGTVYEIGAGPSGLLKAGTPDTQVTWMDAKVGGVPVTPRDGYPVEVNSLWLRCLSLASTWAAELGDVEFAQSADKLRATAAAEFVRRFTWPGVGLYDRLLKDGTPVKEVRPNAVIAGSVDGCPLGRKTLREVLDSSLRVLLVPFGLRTLEPGAPGYVGRYSGGPEERDGAYHQGTAWPWLLGPLVDVARKLGGRADPRPHSDFGAGTGPAACPKLPTGRMTLGDFCGFIFARIADLDEHPCAGTIFEVCSGDPPWSPGGAVSQAWSVAEALRVLTGLETGAWV